MDARVSSHEQRENGGRRSKKRRTDPPYGAQPARGNVPLASNASPCAFRLFWRDRPFPIPEPVALALRLGCMTRSGHRFTEC
jgi:hypothetical protein